MKDIQRATGRHFSAEDKFGIVLGGLHDEGNIVELCGREDITPSLN